MKPLLLNLRGQVAKLFFLLIDLVYPKQKNLFVFGAGSGRSYINNSRYLYEWIKENDPSIEAVWVSKSTVITKYLNKKYGSGSAYTKGDKGIIKLLFRARVVFLTHGSKDVPYQMFQPSFRKTVVQLWHGIGTKRTGYADPVHDPRLLRRENAKYDYVVTNSYIDRVFSENSFRLPSKCYLVTGMPKVDPVIPRAKGAKVKNILYGPTWGSADLFPFAVNLGRLNRELKQRGQVLNISRHRNDILDTGKTLAETLKNYSNIKIAEQGELYDILEGINSNDLLVTDYSSLFWDFVKADKPIVFVCGKGGEVAIQSKIVLDYGVMTGGAVAHSQTELFSLIDQASSYDIKQKSRRDQVYKEYFRREASDMSSCEVLTKKIKEMVGLVG